MLTSYVCFDLETTGLSPDKNEIIEIGAVKVDCGKVTDRFIAFVRPNEAISKMVTSITGITNEMVADAPPTQGIIFDFLQFVGDYPIIGHNLMFDYKFTHRYAQKYYMSFEKEGVDTLAIAKKVLPKLPSRSLENLCRHYGIINPAAHRAYHDALATARLYETLKHYYSEEYPGLFEAKPLVIRKKKVQPATPRQKEYLKGLLKYHKIEFNGDFDALTRSEASRMIDKIGLQFGRMTSGGKKSHWRN